MLGPEELKKLKEEQASATAEGRLPDEYVVPVVDLEKLIRQFRHKLKADTVRLLRADVAPSGDRSTAMFGLAKDLLKAGISDRLTAAMLKQMRWNKFRGRTKEDEQLGMTVLRAANDLSTPTNVVRIDGTRMARGEMPEDDDTAWSFKAMTLSELMTRDFPQPSWLVKGLITERSFTFLAGYAKTYKSTLTMDLAISIASGTPCLNYFEVDEPGPVMLVQEENDPGLVKDRISRIAKVRELDPHQLPIHMYNNLDFQMSEDEHVEALEAEIVRIQPKVVILDPLYLIAGAGTDLIDSREMIHVARIINRIKIKYDTAVLVVHHHRKAGDNPQAHKERMFGSSMLGNAFDGMISTEDCGQGIRVVREFRHWKRAPFTFNLFMGEDDHDLYNVELSLSKKQDDHPLYKLLCRARDKGHPGITAENAAKILKTDVKKVHRWAGELGIVTTTRKKAGGGRPMKVLMAPGEG